MPRKICFVVGTLSQGGAERQLYYMLRVLSRQGHTVTVLCLMRGEYWESKVQDLGVRIIWVGRQKSRPLRLLKILLEVRRLKPDILQSSHFYTNLPTAAAGALLGIPAIGAVRTDCMNEVAGPGRVLGWLNLRAPRFIAANSKAALENARRFGVPDSRMFFLPNVVDCTEFAFTPRPHHNPVRLLTAGRLVPQKRHDKFVNLIARLRLKVAVPVLGMLAGGGPQRSELERQARELQLTDADLEFCGLRADMNELYKRADVFVLTSDFEGTPNVVLEAMSSGLPVVSTDVGDVRHVIQHGVSGFVVNPSVDDALTESVHQLVDDPDKRSCFAQRARRHIETHFSFDRLSEYLETLYSTVERRHGRISPS